MAYGKYTMTTSMKNNFILHVLLVTLPLPSPYGEPVCSLSSFDSTALLSPPSSRQQQELANLISWACRRAVSAACSMQCWTRDYSGRQASQKRGNSSEGEHGLCCSFDSVRILDWEGQRSCIQWQRLMYDVQRLVRKEKNNDDHVAYIDWRTIPGALPLSHPVGVLYTRALYVHGRNNCTV